MIGSPEMLKASLRFYCMSGSHNNLTSFYTFLKELCCSDGLNAQNQHDLFQDRKTGVLPLPIKLH